MRGVIYSTPGRQWGRRCCRHLGNDPEDKPSGGGGKRRSKEALRGMKEGKGAAPPKMRLSTGKALPPICPPQLLAPGWSPAFLASPQAPGQKVQARSTSAHLQMHAEPASPERQAHHQPAGSKEPTPGNRNSLPQPPILPQVRTTPAAQLRLPTQEEEEDGESWRKLRGGKPLATEAARGGGQPRTPRGPRPPGAGAGHSAKRRRARCLPPAHPAG